MTKRDALLNCILLKSSDEASDSSISDTPKKHSDRYLNFLNAHKSVNLNKIVHINPLKFEYINSIALQKALGDFFLNGSHTLPYKCLILTSRQAIESIEMSLFAQIDENSSSASTNNYQLETALENHQQKMIVYCVGEATLNRFVQLLNRLKATCQDTSLNSRLIVRTSDLLVENDEKLVASDALLPNKHRQNAQQLAKLIVTDYQLIATNSAPSFRHKYALYPCSNIRKDEICAQLRASGVEYEEVSAYCTSTNEACLGELEDEIKGLSVPTPGCEVKTLAILVFFSPSGVEAVFGSPLPQQHERCLASIIEQSGGWQRFRLISVGPSTTQKLNLIIASDHRMSGVMIYQLEKPSPQALLNKLAEIY
jgi:uroporphyrinogen-III synthase